MCSALPYVASKAGEESARGARDYAGRLAAGRGKRRREGGAGGKWYDGNSVPAVKYLQVVLFSPRMQGLDSLGFCADAAGAMLNMNHTSRSCSPHATPDRVYLGRQSR